MILVVVNISFHFKIDLSILRWCFYVVVRSRYRSVLENKVKVIDRIESPHF